VIKKHASGTVIMIGIPNFLISKFLRMTKYQLLISTNAAGVLFELVLPRYLKKINWSLLFSFWARCQNIQGSLTNLILCHCYWMQCWTNIIDREIRLHSHWYLHRMQKWFCTGSSYCELRHQWHSISSPWTMLKLKAAYERILEDLQIRQGERLDVFACDNQWISKKCIWI